MPTPPAPPPAPPPASSDQAHLLHKQRRGWQRLWHASGYSLAGLRAGWGEKAFRLEAQLALALAPLAWWISQNWVQTVLLLGSLLLVLITELLNSGIEAAIDRIGPEWHAQSKRAKDLGSAAVLLSLCLCAMTWLLALYHRFI